MRSVFWILCFSFLFASPCCAQPHYAGSENRTRFIVGGGVDFWNADWGGAYKYGPAAWATAKMPHAHGFSINAEEHFVAYGGNLPAYKYLVGEGGLLYSYERWSRVRPFVKAELGFASLKFPSYPGGYSHDTRNTWALGVGAEYHNWGHYWTRIDYTYDGFPNFYSNATGKHHTLNPNGITVGESLHF